MYFDNSSISTSQENKTGVWDTNYKRVYHMGDGSTLSLADSTTNAATATNHGAVTATTSVIGGGANFSGSPNYLSTPTTGLPTGANQVTYQGWFNTSSTNNGTALFAFGTDTQPQDIAIYYTSSTGQLNLYTGTNHMSANNAFVAGTNNHIVVTYDGAILKLYVNGVVAVQTTLTLNVTFGVSYQSAF